MSEEIVFKQEIDEMKDVFAEDSDGNNDLVQTKLLQKILLELIKLNAK